MRKNLLCAAVFLSACASSVEAVILYGAGNEANLTNPGTGLPFDTVARVSSSAGVQDGGSGVHLGGGYMLTAAHIADSELNSVTFDSSTFYSRDLSYTPQQIGATDMKVFKLSSTPTVGAAVLYDGAAELLNGASLVGWGRGRAAGEPLETDIVEVAGGGTPLVKRWGTNDPNRTIPTFTYTDPSGTYTFDALETTLGNTSGNPIDDGTGDFEAAAAFRDSGSGIFQNINGTWYLTGLTSLILQQNSGNVTFGNDIAWTGTSPETYAAPAGTGDPNVFVRISPYSEQINTLVPEPSSLILFLTSGLFLLRRRR